MIVLDGSGLFHLFFLLGRSLLLKIQERDLEVRIRSGGIASRFACERCNFPGTDQKVAPAFIWQRLTANMIIHRALDFVVMCVAVFNALLNLLNILLQSSELVLDHLELSLCTGADRARRWKREPLSKLPLLGE
jgi:hypothetical protein